MFERLDKMRAKLERAKQRSADADAKVKTLEAKLKEAENNQIIADVSAMKLSPEQVAQFLKLVASGQLNASEAVQQSTETKVTVAEDEATDEDYESEDFDNEEDEY